MNLDPGGLFVPDRTGHPTRSLAAVGVVGAAGAVADIGLARRRAARREAHG